MPPQGLSKLRWGGALRVDFLVDGSGASHSLRLAFWQNGARLPGCVLHSLRSWDELEARLSQGQFDVALVQPTFPKRGRLGGNGFQEIGRLHERAPPGRIIPFLDRSDGTPGKLRSLARIGFPIVLIQGVDDDPRSLLRAVCRAKACALAKSSLREAGLQFDLESQKLALSALAGWPPSQSVKDLAGELNLAGRTLRRRMTAAGLPTPQRLVRYGRLLEAHLLWAMGIRSRERIASILHISGGSALAHLTKDLTGLPTDEFFRTARLEDLVTGILAREAG